MNREWTAVDTQHQHLTGGGTACTSTATVTTAFSSTAGSLTLITTGFTLADGLDLELDASLSGSFCCGTAPATYDTSFNDPWQFTVYDPDGNIVPNLIIESADGTFFDVTDGAGTSATPLPAALPLFATGIGGLGLLGWRRKRKAGGFAAECR